MTYKRKKKRKRKRGEQCVQPRKTLHAANLFPSLPMAAAKQHSRKGRKSHRNSFFCFLGGCFGISNKVSADHGDGKSVKNVSSRRGRTAPVNDHKIPTSSSSEILSSSTEIHVVEDDEKRSQILAPPADELIRNNKVILIIS